MADTGTGTDPSIERCEDCGHLLDVRQQRAIMAAFGKNYPRDQRMENISKLAGRTVTSTNVSYAEAANVLASMKAGTT